VFRMWPFAGVSDVAICGCARGGVVLPEPVLPLCQVALVPFTIDKHTRGSLAQGNDKLFPTIKETFVFLCGIMIYRKY